MIPEDGNDNRFVAAGITKSRHYATSRKVAGYIPDEVSVFFCWPNPSIRLWTWDWFSL
jgi:hypothetical protein